MIKGENKVSEKIKIWTVDDDSGLVRYLEILLTRENYEVKSEYNISGARKMLQEEKPDILILDLQLPDGSGRELCSELKEDERYKDIGIIVLSGMTGIDTRIDLIDIGADDYLTKPFSSDELLARIKVVLRRYNKSVQEVLKYGNLEILPHEGQVYLNGQLVGLDDKEYRILFFLVKREEKLVPWEYYGETIWNNKWVDKKIVDENMQNMIKKLGDWEYNISIEEYGYICSKGSEK